jgi:hypothetical protein
MAKTTSPAPVTYFVEYIGPSYPPNHQWVMETTDKSEVPAMRRAMGGNRETQVTSMTE